MIEPKEDSSFYYGSSTTFQRQRSVQRVSNKRKILQSFRLQRKLRDLETNGKTLLVTTSDV